jgi:hypothetical protein
VSRLPDHPALPLGQRQTAAHTQLRTGNDAYVSDIHLHPAGFVMAASDGLSGSAKFVFHCLGDAQPFFTYTKMVDCQSPAVHSNRRGKSKEYLGNYSPVHVFDIPGGENTFTFNGTFQ